MCQGCEAGKIGTSPKSKSVAVGPGSRGELSKVCLGREKCHTASQITIQRILSNLPCVDRHTETLAGKARSLLQNISGEFSRLPLDRILCHGAHDKARNLADRASENRPNSLLSGRRFWTVTLALSGFLRLFSGGSRTPVRTLGWGRAVLVLSLLLALLTVGVLKCWRSLSLSIYIYIYVYTHIPVIVCIILSSWDTDPLGLPATSLPDARAAGRNAIDYIILYDSIVYYIIV